MTTCKKFLQDKIERSPPTDLKMKTVREVELFPRRKGDDFLFISCLNCEAPTFTKQLVSVRCGKCENRNIQIGAFVASSAVSHRTLLRLATQEMDRRYNARIH